MEEGIWVTVHEHKRFLVQQLLGYSIFANSQTRYRVLHADFVGKRFQFAQDAVEAIDRKLKERKQIGR